MKKPILCARNICHSFGDDPNAAVILKDVDVDIFPSEILMLVGPSGSGKTTLIHILGQLLRPRSGKITIDREPVDRLDDDKLAEIRRRYFGFIFQAHNLFPMLSATENVMVALDLLGVRKKGAQSRAHELLATVGLEHRRDAFPPEMSIGQRQRVAIARALAANPAILVADEPTAALDSQNGIMAMQLFKELASEKGRAVVIVTHDSRVFEFADRIIHLEDGVIVEKVVGSTLTFAREWQ
jgi:putative ABC transport system ATP-binding protein